MKPAVLLDSNVLGYLCAPKPKPYSLACQDWLAACLDSRRRLILPEVADFELRRELTLTGSRKALLRLEGYGVQVEFLPVSSAAWRHAAELWADARRRGLPTAERQALDGDVLLAAQALTLGVPAIVATANVAHLSRYCPAATWASIFPDGTAPPTAPAR